MTDPATRVVFSLASLWEVAIKAGLDRPDFRVDAAALHRGLRDSGNEELPIDAAHIAHLRNLPMIHRDPFDRMLIAQAQVEGLILVTHDAQIARYPGDIRRV